MIRGFSIQLLNNECTITFDTFVVLRLCVSSTVMNGPPKRGRSSLFCFCILIIRVTQTQVARKLACLHGRSLAGCCVAAR
jgi:hypothetical protein